uniref:WIZ zinc finger a n=1 Tax=Labrus bergylta TaxID=56723 RepID=A0A3Q3M162_9LABR
IHFDQHDIIMCEVCGTYFETRRGLSSHARLHLRQLGVTMSESSGAPIDLLYQLIQDRDGSLPDFKSEASVSEPTAPKKASHQESRAPSVPEDRSASAKAGSRVITASQKMTHQGSSARLKEPSTSLPPASPSALGLFESERHEGTSSSSLDHQTKTKPMWAPLETDAPITLDTNDEVHVCQLCGCWYETRKGLSSHARAHLRQIGIPDSEIKGSPIDLLYQIMEEEDLKPINIKQHKEHPQNSPPRSSYKRPSNLSSPAASSPSKRPKVSEDCTCILCGEAFENRKGLACHARSHLKQIGVVDLLGKSSAIETVQELVSSGMLEALKPPKTNSTTSGSQTSFPSSSSTPNPAKNSSHSLVNRAPKAKKGFRLAVDPLHRKPKPEPVEIEVSLQAQGSSNGSNSPMQESPAAVDPSKPLNAGKPLIMLASTDEQSPPTVLCDYCGQLFETRKALSCHARAHLRQLGLSWSIKTSPIDLLKEFMIHGEEGRKVSTSGRSSGKATWTPQDTSCELCGFDFENRKALASHARAHLRQLGIIEWKTDGASSPIELLNELIRRDPAKVAALNSDLLFNYFFKSGRAVASPSLSTDSDSVPGSSPKATAHHHQHRKGREYSGLSRPSQGHTRTFGAHSDPNVRPRRVHQLKHTVPAQGENQDTNSQQPSRSGSIPAMLPKPPLTQLVKLVGKMYSLKCRFCEKVFHGPLSVQEQWITHLQEHILCLGYKGKASPPAPVAAPALVHPVAV